MKVHFPEVSVSLRPEFSETGTELPALGNLDENEPERDLWDEDVDGYA